MTTSFPGALDDFTNPSPSDKTGVAVGGRTHSQMHADAFDAIEALEARLGITGSAVTTSHDYKLGNVTGSLRAFANNVTATDRLLGRSTAGAGVIEEIVCTAFARSILDDTNASGVRGTIGAVNIAGDTMSGPLIVSQAGASTAGIGTLITGNALASFYISQNGAMNWGDGTAVADVNLYRFAANVLVTDDTFASGAHVPIIDAAHDLGTAVLRWRDSYFSGTTRTDGAIVFGGDTNLYRLSANTLVTDDTFASGAHAPIAHNTHDFGTSALRWKDGYFAGTVTSPAYNVGALTLQNYIHQVGDARYVITAEAYGCVGNGVTDNTSFIQAAIDALATAGGGELLFRNGTYLTGTLAMKTGVKLRGTSITGTVLKLKTGVNASLITLFAGTTKNIGLSTMTLDGTKASQTAGHGVYLDTTGGVSDFFSHFDNLVVQNCKQSGWFITGNLGGSRFFHVESMSNDLHGFDIQQPDNAFVGCAAGQSGELGWWLRSANNIVRGCKSWGSGRITPSNGHGFWIQAGRMSLTGVEAQDNGRSGFFLSTGAQKCVIQGAVSDSNGQGTTGYGFAFEGCTYITVNGIALDRQATKTQSHAVRFGTSSQYLKVDVTDGGNISTGYSGTIVDSDVNLTDATTSTYAYRSPAAARIAIGFPANAVGALTNDGSGNLSWAAAVSDHGGLTGLGDDDHTQYHTDARGDARYSLLGHTHAFSSLTSIPTTIGGYGITDFNTLGDARWLRLSGGTLTGTVLTQHMRPAADATYDLGTSALSYANAYFRGGRIDIERAAAGNSAYRAYVTGDTFARIDFNSTGLNLGSGAAALDTNLYRSAANVLTTDDSFTSGAHYPIADNVHDLGTSSIRWNDGFFGGYVEVTGSGALKMRPGSSDHTFMEFYARTATPTVRSGYFGYPSGGNTALAIVNELANGWVTLSPGSSGVVNVATALRIDGGSLIGSNMSLSYDATAGHIQTYSSRPLYLNELGNDVVVGSHLKPLADNTWDLGTGALRWNDGFFGGTISSSKVGGGNTAAFVAASSGEPIGYGWSYTSGAVNAKHWDAVASTNLLAFRTLNDVLDATTWLSVTRSGATPTVISFPNGAVSIVGGIVANVDAADWYIKPSANGPAIRLHPNSGAGGYSNRYGSIGWVDNSSAWTLAAITWDENGNVGIGTTSPIARLVVANTTGGNGIEFVPLASGSGLIEFYNRGTSAYYAARYLASAHSFEQGNVTIAGHLFPGSDSAWDLGATGARWANAYIQGFSTTLPGHFYSYTHSTDATYAYKYIHLYPNGGDGTKISLTRFRAWNGVSGNVDLLDFYGNNNIVSNAAIRPATDNGFNLGTTSYRWANGHFATTLTMGERDAMRSSTWGYSSAYKVLLLGSAGTTYGTNATTISLGVDVTANPGGSFSGNGLEILVRNAGRFLRPNSANTEYNIVMDWSDTAVQFANHVLPTVADSYALGSPSLRWGNSHFQALYDYGTTGAFTVGGTSGNYYPVLFEATARVFSNNASQLQTFEIYRDDVHQGGTSFGSFRLQVSAHPASWGHRSRFVSDVKYTPGLGGPYNDPVGDVEAALYSGHVIVWLKGGATYQWRTLLPNSGSILVDGNATGVLKTGNNSETWNIITTQTNRVKNAKGFNWTNGAYIAGQVTAQVPFGSGTSISGGSIYTSCDDNVWGLRIYRTIDDSLLGFYGTGSTWIIAATYGSTGTYKGIQFHTSGVERLNLGASGRLVSYRDVPAPADDMYGEAQLECASNNGSAATLSLHRAGYSAVAVYHSGDETGLLRLRRWAGGDYAIFHGGYDAIPSADNLRSLGSQTAQFANVWSRNIRIGNSTTTYATLSHNADHIVTNYGLIPSTDGALDLGTSVLRWNYFNTRFIISYGTAGEIFSNTIASTSAKTLRIANTGADFYVGIESSVAGGYFLGSAAYDSVLYCNGRLYIRAPGGGVAINGGPLRVPDGSDAAPSYSFTSDTDTGMFLPSVGNLMFNVNGARKLWLDATNQYTYFYGDSTLKYLRIGVSTSDVSFQTHTGTTFYFWNGGTLNWLMNGSYFAPNTDATMDIGSVSKGVRAVAFGAWSGSTDDGYFWRDSVRKLPATYVNGVKHILTAALYTATEDEPVVNTTTETDLIYVGSGYGLGTLTFPAGFWLVGKTVRVTVRGIVSCTGTPTLNVRVKLDSFVPAATGAVAMASAVTNTSFEMVCDLSCRVAGSSGTLIASGSFRYGEAANACRMLTMYGTLAGANISTSLLLAVTAQWGTASASNTIIAHTATVEVLH